MNDTVKKNAAYIGLIGALIITGMYFYQYSNKDYLNYKFSAFYYIIPIVTGITAQVVAKFKSNGIISFKSAVGVYVLAIVLVFLAEAISAYSIYNYLDPEAKTIILEAWGQVGTESQDNLAKNQVFKSPTFSITEYITGIFTKTLMYAVLGLITGLIISKINPPQKQ